MGYTSAPGNSIRALTLPALSGVGSRSPWAADEDEVAATMLKQASVRALRRSWTVGRYAADETAECMPDVLNA